MQNWRREFLIQVTMTFLWQDKGNMAKEGVIGMEVSDVDTNKDGEVRNDCETFQVYASVSAEHKAKKR